MAIEIQVKKPVIELGIPCPRGEQVQPDWNQNDTSAKDYIKNRPGGYYDDPVETEVEIYSGELDLNGGESYLGPKIEIVSGTDDKFASKQSLKTYYR